MLMAFHAEASRPFPVWSMVLPLQRREKQGPVELRGLSAWRESVASWDMGARARPGNSCPVSTCEALQPSQGPADLPQVNGPGQWPPVS